ncbi:hypothetical protein CXG81DRAFT_30344 [Caulochytrium protostelioides]|uniref:Acyl-protein thioesterase 1 n=1 Tax=Caulochytrium protostelioides TaxID=1555241 RepID=A0A4P9WZX1_9FUNG|nr:Phospholipase/carboxylesterase [Caulochytrium protostelioides]RKO98936.1 hypothetical protein CXG81DRAFT_30344 [Caulochytrium protostelioides]|eukprot:RKO98936.1 hypothetical protein CXG81DRAFT_30344 [Caulochytrium protostelioides]
MPSTPFVVRPLSKHTATVVILHGLGDQGSSWSFLGQMLGRRLPHVKWIFPNAPTRPVTLNGGMPMPAWFDIASLNRDCAEDKAGFDQSADLVETLVQAERKLGIPRERIVIGGFSQGAAVTLYHGLRGGPDAPCAGLIALSGWLPMHQAFAEWATNAHAKQIPIFQGHGDQDEVVAYAWGQRSYEALKKAGFSSTFVSYPGLGHSVADQEIEDVGRFLEKCLSS